MGRFGVAQSTFIKVVGFNDVERHSLNTLFRLSAKRNPQYALWTEQQPSCPHVVLVDLESYAGGMEMDSPQANPNLPLVCVGSTPNEKAWKSLTRPVDWTALLNLLDSRFAAPVPAASGVDINLDADFEDTRPPDVSPGRRQALLVGFGREHCLYLRTRLALAGMSAIVEEATVQQAQEQIARIGFNVVVVSLDMADADPWSLVETIRKSPPEASSVIVVSAAPTWKATEKAEQLGCIGLLEIPFSPPQVVQLLQKI